MPPQSTITPSEAITTEQTHEESQAMSSISARSQAGMNRQMYPKVLRSLMIGTLSVVLLEALA